MPKIARPPLKPVRNVKAPSKAVPKLAEKSAKDVTARSGGEHRGGDKNWAGGLPRGGRDSMEPHVDRMGREIMCRSCGIRPGRPTAIIGQLTATELCEVCANLRKERIRQNRAQARGYRL